MDYNKNLLPNQIKELKKLVHCAICNKNFLLNDFEISVARTTPDGKIYCKSCYERMEELKNMTNEIPKLKRPTKIQYYLNMAKNAALRSTCLRRNYGSVIVKDDVIISTGYNGAPRKTVNCIDIGECRRNIMNVPRGQNYELCRAVHSEMNAIISGNPEAMKGATLYMYGIDAVSGELIEDLDCCQMCKRIIINSRISKVIFPDKENGYKQIDVSTWVEQDESMTDKMGY